MATFGACSNFFIMLKCVVCSSVQQNVADFLRSGLGVWQSCARFGLILHIKCTGPRKDFRRFNVDGGVIANIAGVLFSSGDILFGGICNQANQFLFLRIGIFED